jgi:phosphoribosylformimino-5-aminoimidazole carboxamide ribotide isomerase
MRIIPVIDLMDGGVVRGVAGNRQQYRPLQSQLCLGNEPGTVARALIEIVRCEQIYVADLDAIAGNEPNWAAYHRMRQAGALLMLDPGLADERQASAWDRSTHFQRATDEFNLDDTLVVGLETLEAVESLPRILAALGSKRAVFSLDLREGQPINAQETIQSQSPFDLAAQAIAAGFQQLIVLDLASVGTRGGVRTFELCRQIKAAFPAVRLISGGGVRHTGDLQTLAEAGCDAALVASALHDGRLSPTDLDGFRKGGATRLAHLPGDGIGG